MSVTFRYEKKFCCTHRDIDAVHAWIHRSPFFISKQFPDRYVNNIYFDWFNLGDASDNLIGLANREKLRLRWYGEVAAEAPMKLERKIKRDLVGTKQVLDVGDLALAGMSRERLATLLESAQRQSVHSDLRLRNPTVRNRYLRAYYIEVGQRVRITIDSAQGFYGVDSAHDVLRGNRIDYPIYVIEVKYLEQDLERVRRMMNGFPLRPVRHSKYLAGLARLVDQPYF